MLAMAQFALVTVVPSALILIGRLEMTIALFPAREEAIPPIWVAPCIILPTRSLYTLYTTLLISRTALITAAFLTSHSWVFSLNRISLVCRPCYPASPSQSTVEIKRSSFCIVSSRGIPLTRP